MKHRTATNSTRTLADQAGALFRTRFGRNAGWIVMAPGRVNLIGEHTDYNGGYVLPLAIDRHVVIAAGESATGDFRLYSAALDDTAQWGPSGRADKLPHWARYVSGVARAAAQDGREVPPFEAVAVSFIPIGAGLSSSAGIEVAAATLIEAMTGERMHPVDKAKLCQLAEHMHAGVPCGIMDQLSSVLGRHDNAMLIDCRSLEAEYVPLDRAQLGIVIADTGVRHELAQSEYAQRRSECESAAAGLGVATLREPVYEDLEVLKVRPDDVLYRRARHVVTEIQRTLDMAAALRAHDYERAGDLMYASHASLRDDFEVSCPELDTLVNLARTIGVDGGVYGSRMTGAGFGGCTVTLVAAERAGKVAEQLRQRYRAAPDEDAPVFVTFAEDGAQVLAGQA